MRALETLADRVSTDLLATGYIWINYLKCEKFPSCLQVRDEKKEMTKCSVSGADLLSGKR